MIRLAFAVDQHSILCPTTDTDSGGLIEDIPDGLWDQMLKMAGSSHLVVDPKAYDIYNEGEFSENHKMFVLSTDPEFEAFQEGVYVIDDHKKLLEKYHDREDVITVMGGLEVLGLFLPYAKEMRVAVIDQDVPGNLVFDEWKGENLDLLKSEKWQNGTSYYYVKY